MDEKTKMLLKLQKAVARRDWDAVENELDALIETTLDDSTSEKVSRAIDLRRSYSLSSAPRFHGNSGFSGGCTTAAAHKRQPVIVV